MTSQPERKPRTKRARPVPSDEPQPAAREYGRDGITGLVSWQNGVRARDVSQPTDADHALAEQVLDDLLARAQGRRRP